MLLALALALLQGIAPPDAPRTLLVGSGGGYASPARAIAEARPGDTIRVAPGVYREALLIDRRVALLGEPGAVLDGGGAGDVVRITADSAVVAGFAIRGSGRSLDRDHAAVKLERCTGCRVEENRISGSLHGIYLLESRGAVLSGNRITGEPSLAEARRGNGIHLFHSEGNQFERNRIRGTRDGMYFSFSSHNTVLSNDVQEVRYGLHYMYSDDNRFERNLFARNAAGAAIMFSSRILFRDNDFVQHVGYRAYGILLQTSYHVLAERNRIEGNLIGIFLDMSNENTFRHNSIRGNGIGVDLIASAEGNTFVLNALDGNRTAVRKPIGAGLNRWAAEGQGNYWGDRSVFDLDGDGVGDRPYRAADPFATLAALRPVLEVFAGTPAATALSWAERAFPVFDFPDVEDPAPLVEVPAGVPARSAAGHALVPRRDARRAEGPHHGAGRDSEPPGRPEAAEGEAPRLALVALALISLPAGIAARRLGRNLRERKP